MSGVDHQRDPCPWRILEDCGTAFSMGALGGALWHGLRGLRAAPRGLRVSSALSAARTRAPLLGGSFGVWGLTFSAFDCALIGARGREDAWNSVGAGGLTGGLLALRGGPGAALRSAAVGGVLLALIEGAGVLLNRLFAEEYRPDRLRPAP